MTRTNTDRLLEGLNPPQREAVAHTDGPLLILAGPGSGKTRVVTHRAAYLASTVARPAQIVAITFTNKAAREMQERITALRAAHGMTICTFHAFCAKLLRTYSDRAGVSRNFTILDRDDRRKALKQAVENCGLSPANWSPAALEREISRAKNAMTGPREYAESAADWRARTVATIYEAYEALLVRNEGLDFDDLLLRVARLLEADAALREVLENRFRYVLIDEYQDTNAAQYLIARRLTTTRRNLCATGDPDQSIYGWRGADLGNILSFEKDYPDARVVRLEQNYRSTQRILQAADVLIGRNVQRKAKTLWTQNEAGAAVRIIECEDERDEAERIAREIREQVEAGVSGNRIAVCYRINSSSRAIEEAFLHEGIKYQVARGVEFYNRKEIKDTLAYLRVLVNPADTISLLRIINVPPRGIGETTVQRLKDLAARRSATLVQIVTGETEADLAAVGRSAERVRQFGARLKELSPALERSAPEAIDWLLSHSGLRAHYRQDDDVDDAPSRNLDELINAAAAFDEMHPDATVVDWLEHAALVSDVDAVDSADDRVTLMTLHAAKGLEFDVVYIVGIEDGLVPFRRGPDQRCDEEEERRLCFVGMTRARRRLTLTHARFRMMRGSFERTVRSPFLDELPAGEIEWSHDEAPEEMAPKARGQLPDDIEEWAIGTLVRHPVCGLGRVTGMYRGPRRTHVDVQFTSGDTRTWVLEFADLTRVDFDDVGHLESA